MRRTLVLLSLLACAAPLAAAEESWIHLEVRERGHRGARVRMNLPVSALVRALPLIPELRGGRCRFVLGDTRVTTDQMRAMWREIAAAPEGTLVRFTTDGATIEAVSGSGTVRFRARERFDRESTEVTIHEPVVRAIASARTGHDLAAALAALAEAGGGEILIVDEDDTHVRIWVGPGPHSTEE